MIDLPYSLVIEATEDPEFFGFYSPDLRGFTGTGVSVEDCLRQARPAMEEFLEVLRETGATIPPTNPDPKILIENSRPWAEVG
jgi:predicted RNase H-like HicB family nuclease